MYKWANHVGRLAEATHPSADIPPHVPPFRRPTQPLPSHFHSILSQHLHIFCQSSPTLSQPSPTLSQPSPTLYQPPTNSLPPIECTPLPLPIDRRVLAGSFQMTLSKLQGVAIPHDRVPAVRGCVQEEARLRSLNALNNWKLLLTRAKYLLALHDGVRLRC